MGTRRVVTGIVEPLEHRQLLSAIIRVDVNSPAATPDGTSWATAFQDLQDALAIAVAGDEIHIADGTYKPTSGADRTVSFRLKDAVSVYGGYAGAGALDPDLRDVAAFPTVLSGDIGVIGDATDNSHHVLFCLASDAIGPMTELDGLTVRDGFSTDVTERAGGAGLYVNRGSPTVVDCTFTANAMLAMGGGVLVDSAEGLEAPTFIGCAFTGNMQVTESAYVTIGAGACVLSYFQNLWTAVTG